MAETPLLPCCHPAQARAAADPMHGHFFEHGLGITHAPAGGGAADSAVTQLRPSCHPAAMHKAQPKSTCMRTCWLLCVHLQGEERLNTL